MPPMQNAPSYILGIALVVLLLLIAFSSGTEVAMLSANRYKIRAAAKAGPMIPTRHRQMLLSILDLEHVTVNDIMIPRQDIASINVDDNWEDILDQLRQTPHTRLPLHEGELDNLIGIIHMKRVAQELARDP